MKVLLLADINSPHVKRWVEGLSELGIELAVFGFSTAQSNWYEHLGVSYFNPSKFEIGKLNESVFRKLSYLRTLSHLKKVISAFKPDILHAHYATSYGLLGSLSGFHPYLISVWGSDAYVFPQKSYFHKKLLSFNFSKADLLLSTSTDMAKVTSKYTDKKIEVTPFGVDTTFFSPSEKQIEKEEIVIGTVKSFEEVYGVDLLIKAFFELSGKYKNKNMRLQLTGGGTQEKALKDLVKSLDIESMVDFTGKKSGEELLQAHRNLDIAVFPSRIESFGVAIAEASSCGIPVVGTEVGGIPEVIDQGVTGLIVPPENVDAIVVAVERLLDDEPMRIRFGKNGRNKIIEQYGQQFCIQKMNEIYRQILER